MAYGLRVWDQLGRLGTDSSDVLGLAIFADYIPYTAPPAYTTRTINDVDDRPRRVMYRNDFNGRWITQLAASDVVYDAGARTLTLRNTISAQPGGTFFFVMQW